MLQIAVPNKNPVWRKDKGFQREKVCYFLQNHRRIEQKMVRSFANIQFPLLITVNQKEDSR